MTQDKQLAFCQSLCYLPTPKKNQQYREPDRDSSDHDTLIFSKIDPLQSHETRMESWFPAISKGRKMAL